jgi:malate synthase
VLGQRPNQKDTLPEAIVTAAELLNVEVAGGRATEAGVRTNVSVALQYLASWLAGNGAAAINNLMEDAATAEISRSQLWQWRSHGVALEDGEPMTAERYTKIRDEELGRLQSAVPDFRWPDAASLLDDLVLSDTFTEFLTIPAYGRLR